jgi:HlyD family secretion protein
VLPDMSAKIAFLSRPLAADERRPVPALRPEAIVEHEGKDVVFVVRPDAAGKSAGDRGAAEKKETGGGRAVRTVVTTGARIGDLVRVEGLAPGTPVVINPPPALADGAAVAPAKK